MARYIKTIKVKNSNNMLVQIPKHLMEELGLKNGDSFDMQYNQGKIELIPKNGYLKDYLSGQE